MRTNTNLPKELLRVESRLKEVLQPVQPRSGFVKELRIQLDEEMIQKMKSRKVKTGLIVAGGVVGAAVMVITLIRSIMTWPRVVQSFTEKFRKREQAVSV
jgi:hypothetical protein